MILGKYKHGFGRAGGEFKGTVEATPALIERIANFNGKLTATQVTKALEAGKRVYTAFTYYEKMQDDKR